MMEQLSHKINDLKQVQKSLMTKLDNVAKAILKFAKDSLIVLIVFSAGVACTLIYNKINKAEVPVEFIQSTSEITTAIDDHNRLHILNLVTNKTVVFSDSLSNNIYIQLSERLQSSYKITKN